MLPGMHIPQSFVYQRDIGILKKYTDDYYKLTRFRSLRQSGYEDEIIVNNKKNSAGHNEKLSQSLSRSRSRVFELAICNPWENFVTLTIDGKKYNRSDLKLFFKAFSKWMNNYEYQNKLDIDYLLIPEPHKDLNWHLHGLMKGIPLRDLKQFTLDDHLPYKLLNKIEAGRIIYDWTRYSSSFGWSTIEPIYNKEACAKYITKYITKDLGNACIPVNEHLYYRTKGLKRSEEIYRAALKRFFEPDFENDYIAFKRYDDMTEALLNFCDLEEG